MIRASSLFVAALLVLAAPFAGAHAASTRTDLVVLKPQTPGGIVCPAGLTCIGASSTSGKPYLIDNAGAGWPADETQAFLRKTTAPGAPSNGAVYFNTSTGLFQFYSGAWFGFTKQADFDAIEKPYMRTCTITSAAAATPVTCLSDADVPAGKKVYLAGWHAKVNGATAWATTASCSLQDSASVSFVSIAVAAMTGNAFIGDTTANVTNQLAYYANSGGMTGKGLLVVCNANGTGSDLLVTAFGVIK